MLRLIASRAYRASFHGRTNDQRVVDKACETRVRCIKIIYIIIIIYIYIYIYKEREREREREGEGEASYRRLSFLALREQEDFDSKVDSIVFDWMIARRGAIAQRALEDQDIEQA